MYIVTLKTTEEISTRANLIKVAALMMEERGYYGMGINEVLKASGIPKGSLYYHFPGGKDELIKEAIKESGKIQLKNFGRAMKGKMTVEEGIKAVIDFLIQRLKDTGFQYACPVSTVALESVNGKEEIRESCRSAFENLEKSFESYLNLNDLDDAHSYAVMIINMIEGGILLSKAHRDTGHLEAIKNYLPKVIPK